MKPKTKERGNVTFQLKSHLIELNRFVFSCLAAQQIQQNLQKHPHPKFTIVSVCGGLGRGGVGGWQGRAMKAPR